MRLQHVSVRSRTLRNLAEHLGLPTEEVAEAEYVVLLHADHARAALPACGRSGLDATRRALNADPAVEGAEPILTGAWQELSDRHAQFPCSARTRRRLEALTGRLWRIRLDLSRLGGLTAEAAPHVRQAAGMQHAHRHGAVKFAFPLARRSAVMTTGTAPVATPDFHLRQAWQSLARHGGLGMRGVPGWPQAPLAVGVRVAVVDYSWDADHEDLGPTRNAVMTGRDPQGDTGHGTAVAGILMADAQVSGRGVVGIVPHAQLVWSFPFHDFAGERRHNIADAIVRATLRLRPGDVLLLEQQIGLRAIERHLPEFLAISTAVQAGVHVVEPAGNEDHDLDGDPLMHLDHGMSGALMVGAGFDPHTARRHRKTARAWLTGAYGNRIDLQAWGSHVFTTASDPNEAVAANRIQGGDPHRGYTTKFSETSAASALCAGGVALVSAVAQRLRGRPLAPGAMRALLVATGLPATGKRPIGVQPDVVAALAAVRRGLFAGKPTPAPIPRSLDRPVLRLLAVGLDDREIAAQLDLAPAEAARRVRRLLAAFGARSRRRCVWLAEHSGMLTA